MNARHTKDKKDFLVVAMLSRDGESISWIKEIIREADAGISIGRALMLKRQEIYPRKRLSV